METAWKIGIAFSIEILNTNKFNNMKKIQVLTDPS